MIFDTAKMEAVNVVEAHQSPLSCITLNNEGTLLATASEKGTIIRVFSVPEAQKLFQFRRGSIPSRIYSMSFNATSTLLCVSSSTETVHIFRLSAQTDARPGSSSATSGRRMSLSSRDRSISPSSEDAPDSPFPDDSSESAVSERKHISPTLASVLRRTSQNVGKSFAATVGGYLPGAVAQMWEPARDFAWVRIPKASGSSSTPLKTVVAMSSNGPHVMVVTNEGNFYVFTIDLEKGGEGWLQHQYS